MTKRTNLTATTPHGTFTRASTTAYSHVVVRTCPRAVRTVAEYKAAGRRLSGVDQRWAKDGCFAVTWHRSEAAARKAAGDRYVWDTEAVLLGVYPVDA